MTSCFSEKKKLGHEFKCDSTTESELSTTAFKNSTEECRRAGVAQYFRYSVGLDDWGSVPDRANFLFSPQSPDWL
jgi:hypothetical protein